MVSLKLMYGALAFIQACLNYGIFQAFVNGEKNEKKFANLNIEYARGQMPVLILSNANGEEVENLAIDKWDTDTVTEYLTEHLQA